MNRTLLLLLPLFIFSFTSCKKNVSDEVTVYSNDFETSDLKGITTGVVEVFNGTHILGRYNNGFFNLSVNGLPKHDLVTITFDLYIHDNWNGNILSANQPDLWQMFVDGNPYISTTFSNAACGSGVFCPPQSYPSDYPNSNHNPKAGAYKTDLPGFCSQQSNPNGTTQYKIVKTITHYRNKLILELSDKLSQANSVNPKCDKSWSIDNLVIKTVKL